MCAETGRVDYDQMETMREKKIIVGGASAYSRDWGLRTYA